MSSAEWIGQQVHEGIHRATLIGLRKFTNYSCRVRAINNFGNGSWSGLVTAVTDEGGKGLSSF